MMPLSSRNMFQGAPMASSTVLCYLLLVVIRVQLSSGANSSASPPTNSAEVAALLAFKSQLDRSSAERLSTWEPAEASSPCTWQGVTCDRQGSVVALQLQELRLWGSLSPDLAELHHLKHINMSANELSGPIPPQLSHLPFLTHLDLHQNNFTGLIPTSLSLCTNLLLLDLSRNPGLSGTIPPSLASLHSLQILQLHHIPLLTGPLPLLHLPNLTHLCLGSNNLTGTIPSHISLLSKLQHLAIYENPALQGPIPMQIGQLRALRSLKLFNLNLSGSSIPAELGNLTSLQEIYLFNAGLLGTIPQELGNLSNLEVLDLQLNHLTGTIPSSLGSLENLRELNLFSNNLQGAVPSQLGNLSSLTFLYLQSNNLSQSIPSDIGNLHKLQNLSIQSNSLSGRLPAELGRLTNLLYFYASANLLHGALPPQFQNLTRLIQLGLGGNHFAGSTIPSEFGAMESLQTLELSDVQLTGEIPSSLGNLTQLTYLRLSNNMLHGSLPPSLARCTKLVWLKLDNNSLEGEIPADYFTSFSQLHTMSLYRNKLRGEIPEELARLTNLAVLNLGLNNFSGRIPDSLAELHNLIALDLASNRLEGNLASWIWDLAQLKLLDLSNNGFTGAISAKIKQLSGFKLNSTSEVAESMTLWDDDAPIIFKGTERWFYTLSLTLMTSLDLSRNNLQGVIPAEIGELTALFNLNLSGNALQGIIPHSLGELRKLESLDLSSNQLCAGIPKELTAINTLAYFNVSYNRLSGPIPQDGQFSFDDKSYLGNTYLCGEPLDRKCDAYSESIKTCNVSGPLYESNPTRRRTVRIYIMCGASAGAVIVVCSVMLTLWLWTRHSRKHGDVIELYVLDKDLSNVRHELSNFIQQGCNKSNQIGSGGSSSVHKLTLSNGKLVAVKKFNLEVNMKESELSFSRERHILGNIKHINVIKLLGTYSSPRKHACFACIFDFICNGTLDDHLHHINETRSPLTWDKRLTVAIGVAQGLCYLHNESGFGKILHLDIKPSNILLDDDLRPYIIDFGSSRMMGRWSQQASANLSHLIGTIGYVAPECATSFKISDKADVYSFGIVMLELVTGRRPISSDSLSLEIIEEIDLRTWVLECLNMEKDILDHYLQGPSVPLSFSRQEVLNIIQIALLCTHQQPKKRPSMKEVLDMILQ